MQTTTFDKEKERALLGHRYVIGIDEVGRGPLAGPVVAAAVWYKNPDFVIPTELEKEFALIRDSKKLSEKQREKIFDLIHEHFETGIGIISAETIDRVNILEATFLAMKAAVSDLQRQIRQDTRYKIQETSKAQDASNKRQETSSKVQDEEGFYFLIDGNQLIPNFSYKQEAIVGGDGIAKSIAAASIIAKVTRDRMIVEYDKEYPGYGFAEHKGYGTKVHMDALRHKGPCPIHRKSFRPVQLALPENVNKRFANVLKPKKS
jgi:ribonuclease HII